MKRRTAKHSTSPMKRLQKRIRNKRKALAKDLRHISWGAFAIVGLAIINAIINAYWFAVHLAFCVFFLTALAAYFVNDPRK